MSRNLRIEPVALATRAEFAALLNEGAAWQKLRGSEGWTKRFDDSWMLPRIARGELFLAYAGEEAVAAFRILWEDRPFWGDREQGDSIYLHSFAVRRSRAGQGIGAAVIEHVVRTGRDAGRALARLDCHLSSRDLIAWYERHGFRSVGTTRMEDWDVNLMERPIG